MCMCHCRYYPALRTLEQLEQRCLPRAGQYRFCSIMAENIPKLRTHIRDTAMTQLRDFLESIRKHSDKIGEAAIKQVHIDSLAAIWVISRLPRKRMMETEGLVKRWYFRNTNHQYDHLTNIVWVPLLLKNCSDSLRHRFHKTSKDSTKDVLGYLAPRC